MLTARDLVVAVGPAYGEEVLLRGASLDVSAGEAVCVVGRTGSGKTTLGRVLVGALPPRFGDVSDGFRSRSLLHPGARDLVSEAPAAVRGPHLRVVDDAHTLPAPVLASLLRTRRSTDEALVLLSREPLPGCDRTVRLEKGALLPVTNPRDSYVRSVETVDACATSATPGDVYLPADELTMRARLVLQESGAPPEVADTVAEVLVDAERRGHPSHGVALLPTYVARVREGGIDPRAVPDVAERGHVARIDAAGGFGQVAARKAAGWTASAASRHGVAAAAVSRNNHVGMLAAYRWPFQESGTVGLLLNISGPSVSPPGSTRATLGSNALCLVTPTGAYEPFVVDMATGAVAAGKIRDAANRGVPVPRGWLLDATGQETTDPSSLDNGGSVPMFGDYKGLGVSLVVEVLAGLLGGGTASPRVAKQRKQPEEVMNCSQLFVGFSLSAFGASDSEEVLGLLHEAVVSAHESEPPWPHFPDQQEAEHVRDVEARGVRVPASVANALGWSE